LVTTNLGEISFKLNFAKYIVLALTAGHSTHASPSYESDTACLQSLGLARLQKLEQSIELSAPANKPRSIIEIGRKKLMDPCFGYNVTGADGKATLTARVNSLDQKIKGIFHLVRANLCS